MKAPNQRLRMLAAVAAVVLVSVVPGAAQIRFPGGSGAPKAKTPSPKRGKAVVTPRAPLVNDVIVTTRPRAQILITGRKPEVADERGQFHAQLRVGTYEITVSAGEDYEPRTERFTISARDPAVLSLDLVPRFGVVSLNLPRLAGAEIAVDGQRVASILEGASGELAVTRSAPARDGKPIEVTVDSGHNLVTLARLAPGRHVFSYGQPGRPAAEQSILIEVGPNPTIFFPETIVTARLELSTTAGTSVFVDGALLAEADAHGRVAGEVPSGTHEIKLVRKGFRPWAERHVFQPGKTVSLAKTLDPELTSVGFLEDFDLSLARWTTPPSGWRIVDKALTISDARTLGFPTGIIYDDFVLSFNVTLDDGSAAAWAVRARDANSYYLFVLSGPNGPFPNRFLSYVVRDGTLDVASPAVGAVKISSPLRSGGVYSIDVTVRGDTIAHQLTPVDTGQTETLPPFRDASGAYPYGGFGFRTIGAERFTVDSVRADVARKR